MEKAPNNERTALPLRLYRLYCKCVNILCLFHLFTPLYPQFLYCNAVSSCPQIHSHPAALTCWLRCFPQAKMISYSTYAILLLHLKIFLMEVFMVVHFSHCMTEFFLQRDLIKMKTSLGMFWFAFLRALLFLIECQILCVKE